MHPRVLAVVFGLLATIGLAYARNQDCVDLNEPVCYEYHAHEFEEYIDDYVDECLEGTILNQNLFPF